jgi:hypothetical protein
MVGVDDFDLSKVRRKITRPDMEAPQQGHKPLVKAAGSSRRYDRGTKKALPVGRAFSFSGKCLFQLDALVGHGLLGFGVVGLVLGMLGLGALRAEAGEVLA